MCRRHHLLFGADAPGFATGAALPHYAPDLPLEPVHLDADLRFDRASRSAEGAVTTTVVARDEAARSLALDAVGLTLHAVEDPDGHALAHSYDGERLTVTWAEPVPVGDDLLAEVEKAKADLEAHFTQDKLKTLIANGGKAQ